MAAGRLAEIVTELLLFAHAATGYAIPGKAPQVATVPQSYLARAACGQPCRIHGWYPYGSTVYLNAALDVENDPRARAILLHELVHYLQNAAHAYESDGPCRGWQRREFEAYRVQARWLTERNVPVPSVRAGLGAVWRMGCPQTTALK